MAKWIVSLTDTLMWSIHDQDQYLEQEPCFQSRLFHSGLSAQLNRPAESADAVAPSGLDLNNPLSRVVNCAQFDTG